MDATFICRRFPAQTAQLRSCCEFVREGAAAAALSAADMDRLELVLEELFMNVARYAYAAPDSGDVEVAYTVEGPGRLLVQISDTGHEFNPLASDPPDFSRGLAERPVGGLGIFLIKSIAETITYEREGDCNRVSFLFAGSSTPGED